MGVLNITLSLDLTFGSNEKPEEEDLYQPTGTDASIEAVGEPERPSLGFCPPSDPMRSTTW